MKHNRVLSSSLIICLIVSSSFTVHADSLGTLYYWYSGDYSIGHFYPLTIYVEEYNLSNSSWTEFPFYTILAHAYYEWNNVLPISFTTTFQYAPRMEVYGGTKEQLNAAGIPIYSTGQNGYTVPVDATYDGAWELTDSTLVCCYTHQHTVTAIVEKDHSIDAYKKTATHEIGHALGWYGHSSCSDDVMYGYTSSVTHLTMRDYLQLDQVY